jgi:hypothetical protein
VLDVLARLGADLGSGVYLRPGCDEAAILQLQAAAEHALGEVFPAGFVRLLRLTNGVQINGAYFKEVENVVAENLDVPHPDIIVLGTEGNMAEFVFDKRDRQFHIINMGFPDERFNSFTTFEELLLAVLKEQQVH